MEKLFHNFLWGRHVLHFAMQSVRVHLSTLQMYFCIQFVCFYSAFWYYIVKSQVRSIIWLTGFFTTTVMFPSGISISGTQFFAGFWFQWTCMLLGIFLSEYVKRAQHGDKKNKQTVILYTSVTHVSQNVIRNPEKIDRLKSWNVMITSVLRGAKHICKKNTRIQAWTQIGKPIAFPFIFHSRGKWGKGFHSMVYWVCVRGDDKDDVKRLDWTGLKLWFNIYKYRQLKYIE